MASDIGNSVLQTKDGGYILTGNTESYGEGSTDIYVIKTDTNGNMLWTKTFGGSESEYGKSIVQQCRVHVFLFDTLTTVPLSPQRRPLFVQIVVDSLF